MSAIQVEGVSNAQTSSQSRVGRFSHNPVEGAWSWNDDVFRILGLLPWSVTPSTEHLVSSTHPEDRQLVSETLDRAATDGQPFSLSYRLTAADDAERKVLMVGVARRDRVSTPVIDGYLVDLTEDFRQDAEQVARRAVHESAQHRATIERALGGLMVAYGLDGDGAFDMLRWWSQNRNMKVRDLAGRLVEAASRGATSATEIRETFDELLHDVTAHRTSPGDDASLHH